MSSKLMSRVVFMVSVLLITQTFLLASAQEGNPLPAPTGPYAVGVEWRHWVDESRDETFDAEPHGKREMMVKLLYPVDKPAAGDVGVYMMNSDQVMPEFASVLKLVNLDVPMDASTVADLQSYAIPNASLSDAQAAFPVLVFSHGGGASVEMYSAQIEELASQGYIVAAINHAYGTSAIVFPDGRTVKANYSLGFDGTAALWSQDQRFVIDQLEAINTSDPENTFSGRLDLEHLGVLGQSLGGSAATMTCFADRRCKALAVGDSPIYGDVIEQGLDQPALYLLSVSRFFSNPEFFAQSRGPFYAAAFKDFEHLDFGDFPLWQDAQPFRDALWLGSVEPARAVELTRAYLVAFFNQYLKGESSPLLAEGVSSAYPEVTIEASNVPVLEEEAKTLTEAEAMAFAERFNAIFDGPQLEIADEIMAENFTAHLPLAPELDRQGWKDYVASFYVGFPDLKESVNKVIVGEDRVVLYVSYTGTHDGDFFGIPATGKQITMDGIGIFRFDEAGKAVENWAVVDVVGIMAQIGAFPPA